MNYEFTLDKKAVISLIAGSLVIGILLFAAGWIVGMQWSPNSSSSSASAIDQKEDAELPKEPVLTDEAPAPKSAPRKSMIPPVDQPNKPVTAAPEEAALSVEAPAAANGEVKIIQEEAVDAAESAAAEPDYVTVQIGVFLDEQEASRLLKQVERKGYAPTFFSGTRRRSPAMVRGENRLLLRQAASSKRGRQFQASGKNCSRGSTIGIALKR